MPGTSDPLLESSLRKLTVPQLKALCKERRITGYGKIPKDSIIAKLLQWKQTKLSSQSAADPIQLHSVPNDKMHGMASSDTISSETAGFATMKSNTMKSPARPGGTDPQQSSLTSLSQALHRNATLARLNTVNASQRPSYEGSSRQAAAVNTIPQTPLELPSIMCNTLSAPSVLPASIPTSEIANKRPATKLAIFQGNSNKKFKLNVPPPQPRVIEYECIAQKKSTSIDRGGTAATRSISKRRFAPLVQTSGIPTTPPLQQAGNSKDRVSNVKPYFMADTYRYLDFETSSFNIPLKTLSFPPTLSQQKRVPGLALTLREISYNDLKSCVTVSRSFRYAAYMVATRHLRRHFSGKRTEKILAQYPTERTNFWPYLLYRQHEAATRRRIYEESFLGQALKSTCLIKKELWGSPSHERQAMIAVRFLLTKMYSMISVGGDDGDVIQKIKSGTVLDAEQIVPNEVWKITFLPDGLVQVFYVLESTCEVIGQAAVSGQTAPSNDLRADWLQYISTRISQSGGLECTSGLWDKISWTNHEEYDRGISKHWLSRIAHEGAVGQAKLEVAQRYILACVVCNSVSGTWRSSTEMCQDINGACKLGPTTIHKTQRVNLFLPAHHHVESVHFNLGGNGALHPALAVIQTPAREYYVLRDNGMQVGCEEDGIAPIWKEVLGM